MAFNSDLNKVFQRKKKLLSENRAQTFREIHQVTPVDI